MSIFSIVMLASPWQYITLPGKDLSQAETIECRPWSTAYSSIFYRGLHVRVWPQDSHNGAVYGSVLLSE